MTHGVFRHIHRASTSSVGIDHSKTIQDCNTSFEEMATENPHVRAADIPSSTMQGKERIMPHLPA